MKPSQDQIKTAQKLLVGMQKEEGHTHGKESRFVVYEVRGGVVSQSYE